MHPPSATAGVTANGKPAEPKPTKNKIYYDIASWFITQVAFSFTVSPFIMLTFRSSMTVWARVYFYCIIGVVASVGFLFSPAKLQLIKALKKRNGEEKPGIKRTKSVESIKREEENNILGVPNDPERELNEIVREVREEIESRQRRGSSVENLDVRKLVEEKWNELTTRKEQVKQEATAEVKKGMSEAKQS